MQDTLIKTSTTIALELSKSSTAQEHLFDSQRTTVFYDAFFSLLLCRRCCDNIIALSSSAFYIGVTTT
jgi:hypothetical protein